MSESRSVWGIEIGQYGLKALKLRYADASEQVVAVAFDYIQHPKILSQPDAIPEEMISQALETFLSRNDVGGDVVAISVPGPSSLIRFVQLPPVEASKVAEIIKYEARQQIPFALEEVIWDYQPLAGGVEESGYMLDSEVGLFAMKREDVEKELQPYLDQKVEVDMIQIAPLTLYNVLCYDQLGLGADDDVEATDEYTIMLDMGCDNTSLMVSNGAKIWVRNVPLGGNHFTRALTKEMKLSFAKAEHLKCNATKSPDPRAVFQALRPVFNDYVSEIQRSIGFFSSVNRQAKVTKVVGVGNGFKLAGLQKFLQQNLQYEVERPDTYKGLAGDAVLNAPLFQENLLSFAVPYGLALQGLKVAKISTTLLPPEIATARKIRKKKPWAVAAAAALVGGFALSMIGNSISYGVVNSEGFADAEKEAESLDGTVKGLQGAYASQESAFESAKEEGNSLVAGRRNLIWLELYTTISAALPRDEADRQDISDIEKRNQVIIKQVTTEHVADVAEWFAKVPPARKGTMTAADQESEPTGEGYIVTLVGEHFHHDENDTGGYGVNYVEKHFLPSLQQWQVSDGVRLHDVTRMGISHAAVTNHMDEKVNYYPGGRAPQAGVDTGGLRASIGGLSSGGFGGTGFGRSSMQPGAMSTAGPPTASGTAAGAESEKIHRTKFVVEFLWTPIERDERPTENPATAEGEGTEGEAADGETSDATASDAATGDAATTEESAPAEAETSQ